MLPKIVLNNCTINIVLSPQGFKPDIQQPTKLEDKLLQLEQKKDPVWLSAKEASEAFGLSEGFFFQLAKRMPELSDPDNKVRTFLNQDAVSDYLREHPEHKFKSYQMKKEINVPMLTERAYNILRDEGKEMYPDLARVPTARRSRYISYTEMASRLGVSYSLYYKKIRIPLSKMVKMKPEEVERKKQEQSEWDRVTGSWKRTLKRDKELGR